MKIINYKKHYLLAIFCFILYFIYFFSILHNSPFYKYVKCAKQKCKSINLFVAQKPFNRMWGISIVAGNVLDELEKRNDLNIYVQSEQTMKMLLIPRFIIDLLHKESAKYSDIVWSPHALNSIEKKWFKDNILIYSTFHDTYQSLKLKDLNSSEVADKMNYFMSNKVKGSETAPITYHLKDNKALFAIAQTSVDDYNLLLKTIDYKMQYYVMHWPLIKNNSLNKKLIKTKYNLFDKRKDDKTQKAILENLINTNSKYIILPPKNYEETVRAVAKIREKHNIKDLYVTRYGKNGGGEFVQKMINKEVKKENKESLQKENLNKYDFFIQLGFIEEDLLEKFMHNSLALINIIPYEGYGLPIVHAMSMGLPIVASNSGSISEVLEDGGYLLKNKAGCKLMKYFSKPFLYKGYCEIDEDDLFNVLEKLYLDQKYREEMSQKALKTYNRKVQNGLTWPSLVDKMVNIWKKDLGLV